MIKEKSQALKRCLVISFILCGILLKLGIAQEIRKPPLGERDILALATSCKLGELSPSRVVDLIREQGLEFSVTDSFLSKLEDLQADAAIVQALRKLKGQAKAPAPPPSITQEGDLTSPNAPVPSPPAALTSKIPDHRTWPEFLERVRDNCKILFGRA